MEEYLFEFVRVPRVYGEPLVKTLKSGKDLVQLTHIDLKNSGMPWGVASHVMDGINQLNSQKDGIFAPVFIEARPYNWPYNGNLTMDNTALIIIDMQRDFVGPQGYVGRMYGKEGLETLRKPIEPLKKLLSVVRPLGMTIIHTREGHNKTLTDCPGNKRWRSEGVAGGIGNPGKS